VAQRSVYEDRYREVRHKVFAHRALSTISEVNELLANTSIDEMKELFSFLSALYSCLWELFENGREPIPTPREFALPPDPPRRHAAMLSGETIYREGQAVLWSMLPRRKIGVT
jgi:hypothetical protein